MTQEYKKPYKRKFNKEVKSLNNNNILLLRAGNMTLFWGIGNVFKIERGENFDIVYADFGFAKNPRAVVITHNQARRQILTLKRGQFALFWGQAKTFKKPSKFKGVANPTYREWALFGYVVSGFYVPKAFDVKKMESDIENGIEQDETVPLNKNLEKHYEDIINGLFEEEDIYGNEDDD